MPLRPPPPEPPPPVCMAHRVAVRGDCPECEREFRIARWVVLALVVLMVGAVVAFLVQALR